GIRDFHVTGVQTCALPIFLNVPRIDKFFLAMDAIVHPETGEIVCNIAYRNPSPEELAEFMEGKLLPSPLSPEGVPADSPIGPLEIGRASCRGRVEVSGVVV